MSKEKRKSRGSSWDDVPMPNEGKRYDDQIEVFKFSDAVHTQIRLIGDVFAVKVHWVPTILKDGSRGQFPKLCLHNSEDAESCPYCKAGIRTNTRYYTNAIIRDLEETRPKKAKYDPEAEFKRVNDDNWTPIRVVSFPASVMQKILNFKSLTKIKTKDGIKTFHVSHPKYGRDLSVKLDPSGTGSGMYDVQREQVSKLEGEEKEYLPYDIDTIYDAIETEDEALAILRSCYDRGTFEGAKDKQGNSLVNLIAVQKMLGVSKSKKHQDVDDEDDYIPKKKKKKYQEDDDIEDEIDTDAEEDDGEDEDEEPRKKSSKKSKKYQEEDDEDEDEDLEDDDEELEDEEPRKKSKKDKKSKKHSRDEEDEDEEDDTDDNDEDSVKSSKKSKKKSKKSRDEDDEDEEDEEDEKPRKKSKSLKKSKKSREEEDEDEDLDDEDEDEDLDDEDEEEEEKPSKKSKKLRSR